MIGDDICSGFFYFKQKTAYEMRISDWSSDVCSSDLPLLWGNKADAGYLRGEEWMEASRYVAAQIHKLIEFLEFHTGRPFDWDALRQSMHYIEKDRKSVV